MLAFLDTAYFDSVERAKERYDNAAIELVAEARGRVVGLLDVECEQEPGTVCSDRPGLGGMIWHLAVHPNMRRRGVATRLLEEAESLARARGLVRFEAWTRDDEWVQRWYESRGFEQVTSYLHVYASTPPELGAFQTEVERLNPAHVFAHYTGPDREHIRSRFARVHECVLYERRFDSP